MNEDKKFEKQGGEEGSHKRWATEEIHILVPLLDSCFSFFLASPALTLLTRDYVH